MTDNFAELSVRLVQRAKLIAEARVQELRLARTDPAARWRKAALLWPQFTKG
jgi:hypothetical protein